MDMQTTNAIVGLTCLLGMALTVLAAIFVYLGASWGFGVMFGVFGAGFVLAVIASE